MSASNNACEHGVGERRGVVLAGDLDGLEQVLERGGDVDEFPVCAGEMAPYSIDITGLRHELTGVMALEIYVGVWILLSVIG